MKRCMRGMMLLLMMLLCSGCGILQMIPSSGKVEVGMSSPEVSVTQSAAPTEAPVTDIQAGAVLTTDAKQIVVNRVELIYDVLPDDTSGFYTHYAADQGKVYICVDMDVTNTAKQNLPCDEILKITADYNNGYTYSGFTVVDDSTTGFTYANITTIDPLSTQGIKYLIACPAEVEESQKPLFLTFEVDGETFRLTIR